MVYFLNNPTMLSLGFST